MMNMASASIHIMEWAYSRSNGVSDCTNDSKSHEEAHRGEKQSLSTDVKEVAFVMYANSLEQSYWSPLR
jgi:hypothetical protein